MVARLRTLRRGSLRRTKTDGGMDGWPAFARYGATVFVRASEKPAFASYGAAAFARAKAEECSKYGMHTL